MNRGIIPKVSTLNNSLLPVHWEISLRRFGHLGCWSPFGVGGHLGQYFFHAHEFFVDSQISIIRIRIAQEIDLQDGPISVQCANILWFNYFPSKSKCKSDWTGVDYEGVPPIWSPLYEFNRDRILIYLALVIS